MRAFAAFLLVAALGGCTSVKVLQRDGCWIRRTEKVFGQVREDVGPCARTASPWSDDRLTRLVQECVAREDYRWQMRALAAWNRGDPLPAERNANVLATCTSEAARAGFAENDALKNQLDAANERISFAKERLADVASDRDALRKRSDAERDHMYESHERLAQALGEAAKKPAAPAVATATASSDGRARLDTEEKTKRTEGGPRETAPVAFVNAAPWMAPSQPAAACAPSEPAKRSRAAKKPVVAAKAPECAPPPAAAQPGSAPSIAAPAQPVVEAGNAAVAPVAGPVVNAAEEKPAFVPAPAAPTGAANGE
jgi:chemotaxis protein histidine kinase CheA